MRLPNVNFHPKPLLLSCVKERFFRKFDYSYAKVTEKRLSGGTKRDAAVGTHYYVQSR